MVSKPVPWPDEKKCAVGFSFDCDSDSLIHTFYPDTQHQHALTTSWLRYDEIAVPRLGEMFDSLGIKQTFFVPAWCILRYPESFEPLLSSGHEIALHGYIHESPNLQTPEAERHWFEKTLETLSDFIGEKPVGYRVPWGHLSTQTLELLAEAGCLYDSSLLNDHNPYVLETSKGELIELPTDVLTIEDWSQYANVPAFGASVRPAHPDAAMEVYWSEFEAAYDLGALFVTTFHPMVSGRPARLRRLRTLIERMQDKGDVWFAPLAEIAAHVRKVADESPEEVRRVEWPFYPDGAVPEFQENRERPELTLQKTE
jgi:peptidoglycan/xylan/chitin deacetylase (PgdA/CDA1 family)